MNLKLQRFLKRLDQKLKTDMSDNSSDVGVIVTSVYPWNEKSFG